MITQETAGKIWDCYREIAAGEQLLTDMEASAKEYRHDVRASSLKDAFGKRRHLQLGVPTSDSSHRILDVAPDLAKSVIHAHIANMRARLAEANEQARIEILTNIEVRV